MYLVTKLTLVFGRVVAKSDAMRHIIPCPIFPFCSVMREK